jgi:hypothetical protein
VISRPVVNASPLIFLTEVGLLEVGKGVENRPHAPRQQRARHQRIPTPFPPLVLAFVELALPLGALLATERALADPAATALAAMILVLTRLVLPGTQGHGAPR